MADRDYYAILGVPRDATPEQIKKAYRNLARKLHPDVNPGDKKADAQFKELQQAYDVLSEKEKRELYDRVGHAAYIAGVGAGHGPRAGAAEWAAHQAGPDYETIDFSSFFGPGDTGGCIFDDILSKVSGGSRTRKSAGPRSGRTLETHLSIPFLTAVRGGETSVELERADAKRESLVVKIPPGIESGAKLRLKGRGEPGERGGPAGDLVIAIEVDPHPYFHREGRDLTVEVPITLDEAVLGARVEVPSLDGPKTLPVPPGSSSGQRLRLRGLGVPGSGDRLSGDLYVVLRIVVPKSVDEASQQIIRDFALRNPMRPRAGLW